jgi:hypothetical protein
MRIGKQREAEPILLVECLLPIHRIGADSYALGTEFCELALQVAEVTAFLRSTRGHGFWVEEEDEGSAFEKIRQTNLLPILVGRAEVIHDVVVDHALDSCL